MLTQGVKTINAEFIRTCALSQLSFFQLRLFTTLQLLLSLTLMPKIKKTLETLRSRPPLKQVLRFLFQMWIIWKNRRRNFIQKKYGKKDVCHAHTFRSLECNFSFCTDILHR